MQVLELLLRLRQIW